jgi:acetoin utilization deacetylase AcuC-like enzyme
VSRTGLVYHPLYRNHLTGPDHPERPERVVAVVRRLEESGLTQEIDVMEPGAAETRWLALVHGEDYIARVRDTCERGDPLLDSGDTSISTASYKIALLAAGGALAAADRILAGDWRNAFVACRPPGHHAEARQGMGFCLFNNAAVVAAYLRHKAGVDRVAVLDWDVHHGNGTQHIFETDPTVFYASLHQWPLYPGTGRAEERGVGAGVGATLNCPMSAGDGDDEYLRAFDDAVLPALSRFAPEVVVISAGFDAHSADPLSGTRVSTEGFRLMTRLVADLARSSARGRVISLLEGGYDLEALAASVQVHVEELKAAGESRDLAA